MKTKWIPFCSHRYANTSFITFCRMNTKTGMMYFKTKSICSRIYTDNVPYPTIDVEVIDES
jgi:hypothetical protein